MAELYCPKCQNILHKKREAVEKHFFKPTIWKETLTCPVCGWKKIFKVFSTMKSDTKEEWNN